MSEVRMPHTYVLARVRCGRRWFRGLRARKPAECRWSERAATRVWRQQSTSRREGAGGVLVVVPERTGLELSVRARAGSVRAATVPAAGPDAWWLLVDERDDVCARQSGRLRRVGA